MRKRKKHHYDERKVFLRARAVIKKWFGIELTLIEQIRMKEYIPGIIKEREGINALQTTSAFNPAAETVARFMTDYYGLHPIYSTAPAGDWRQAYPILVEHDKEFKELMKLKQERAHKP